jgi:hypothetical protein
MLTVIFRNCETDRTLEKEFRTRKEAFQYLEKNELLSMEHYEYSDEHMGFVNVYEVTREYGGPEEGGWYYNSLRCIEAIPVRHSNSYEMVRWAKEQYKHIKHGNIYSVLGGSELEVMWEENPCDSETQNRPYYE